MSIRLRSISRALPLALASCVAIAVLGVCASPVHAEDSVVDPKFRAAVRTYIPLQGSPEQLGQSVAYGAANETLSAIAQSGVEITEPMKNIVLEQALETYAKRFGDVDFLTDLWAPIYAQHFSEKEIRTLIDFYQSPIGKKSLEVIGPINEAGMAAIQESAIAITPEFQLGVSAKLQQAGIDTAPALVP